MPPTYDRPVKATLHVHLDNGEQWPVTHADLAKFNLVDRHTAYLTFDDALTETLTHFGLLDDDLTSARLNAVRYLVETAIVHPDLLDHPEHEHWAAVADLERTLQSSPVLPSGGQP